ncbi:MAG: cell wall metabolism sensor histidine kinase WalK [Actinomycetota bacterium]|nr:cell wall metabolism sensor histidine kinase WalK [Actinomycetota bacterium]
MNWIERIRDQPWRVAVAAVAGLLVAITIAGLVGLLLNRNVETVTNEALRYDVQLEDEGDDLRAAVLDLRHYHRNIHFGGPWRANIENFENAYGKLEEEISELEAIGVRDPDAPQPEEIRAMAEEYYERFRPAIDLYGPGPEPSGAFEETSDRGLVRIDEMAQAGTELDELGEQLSEKSLAEVDRATRTARLVWLTVICGLLLVGAGLAYATVRVVNDLRRLYAEQQQTTQKLAEANRAKIDFIADVSHELRTPLTVLRGNAQVGLIMDGDGEHEEILEEIVEESKRMSRMVEDLLLLARSDSASLRLTLETVAVEPFVTELAGRAEILARERGATLETELRGEGLARLDPQRIQQAALTLVDNAAKYGQPGGKVTLSSSVRAGELRIAVEDRGPGIPGDELPRIFERFYRLDKARSRKLGGTGLGLPIAKAIVEAHGGHIEAVSRLGEGTKMTLCLPLLAESQPVSEELGRVRTPEDG